MVLKVLSKIQSFGGELIHFSHQSHIVNCEMKCAVFLPPQAEEKPVPVLYWLSGLTCTDENFMQKAGAHRIAAKLGIAIVAPDTSPRGSDVPDDSAYDLGQGAGFYVNATQEPWASHFKMYDYVLYDLPALIEKEFNVSEKRSISGHSMGGHGALTIAFRNPLRFLSVSAFSPIVNPMECPWGKKAFTAYLGSNQKAWEDYDACELISKVPCQIPLLVDQGTADQFLEGQLFTEQLIKQSNIAQYPAQIRFQEGYDHSYYFISSFIEEHFTFHASYLLA